MIFAISMEVPAMLVNPSKPAIRAIIRNVNTQDNMCLYVRPGTADDKAKNNGVRR